MERKYSKEEKIARLKWFHGEDFEKYPLSDSLEEECDEDGFYNHISKEAMVTTDCWKGYRPLMKDYDITQIVSVGGLNFNALHTMIHQVESWIRTTYSWVSDSNINRYLNEFCYRINRSQMKENIFNNINQQMVSINKVYQSELICN